MPNIDPGPRVLPNIVVQQAVGAKCTTEIIQGIELDLVDERNDTHGNDVAEDNVQETLVDFSSTPCHYSEIGVAFVLKVLKTN